VKPTGFDLFGPYWQIPLQDGATELAYILHRGDTKDPGPDQFLTFADYGHEVWQLENADPESPYILPVPAGGAISRGDLTAERAHWVDADTIVWPGATDPTLDYSFCHAPDGGLALDDAGITGGECVELSPAGTFPDGIDGRLHLAGAPAFDLPGDLADDVPRSSPARSPWGRRNDGARVDATGLQIPGVLDDLFATDAELGVSWDGDVPTIRLWAPTAKSVTLRLYDDSTTPDFQTVDMTNDAGVWSATGDASWRGSYYLFEVEVYAPSTGRSRQRRHRPVLAVAVDELDAQPDRRPRRPGAHAERVDRTPSPSWHGPRTCRSTSCTCATSRSSDETVPAADRGTFAAFTHDGSDGMQHLARRSPTPG
jgi:pullulanase